MQNLTWPPNAVTVALLWPFITALASLFYRAAEANPRTHAFLSTVAGLGIDLPKVWDALGRMVTGNLPPSTAARKAASVRPLTMVLLVVGLFALVLSGCMSSAPVVPVTPQNQAQVSSCENSATWHNTAVLAGIGLGVVGTGLGSVAAVDQDPNVRAGLAIGGASSAALAGGAAAVAAFAAQNFANSQCPSLVGPLPMKPGNAASAWPADWPPPGQHDSVVVTVQSAQGVISSVTSPAASP